MWQPLSVRQPPPSRFYCHLFPVPVSFVSLLPSCPNEQVCLCYMSGKENCLPTSSVFLPPPPSDLCLDVYQLLTVGIKQPSAPVTAAAPPLLFCQDLTSTAADTPDTAAAGDQVYEDKRSRGGALLSVWLLVMDGKGERHSISSSAVGGTGPVSTSRSQLTLTVESQWENEPMNRLIARLITLF